MYFDVKLDDLDTVVVFRFSNPTVPIAESVCTILILCIYCTDISNNTSAQYNITTPTETYTKATYRRLSDDNLLP